MKRLVAAAIFVFALIAPGLAQEEKKDQVPPPSLPTSEAEKCKPQPACRLLISPLVPGAPGGGLKTYGYRHGDPRFENWAGRDPLDPRSFRLPQEHHV